MPSRPKIEDSDTKIGPENPVLEPKIPTKGDKDPNEAQNASPLRPSTGKPIKIERESRKTLLEAENVPKNLLEVSEDRVETFKDPDTFEPSPLGGGGGPNHHFPKYGPRSEENRDQNRHTFVKPIR